ncbi:MAG: Uma2 family endonuclease [Pyrinomonadaceae bacterium]
MNTLTTDCLEIIERLPAGAKLQLPDVAWDEYEHLLSQMEMFPGHRLSYDRGRLDIMSPKRDQEAYKFFIGSIVGLLAEEQQMDIEPSGTATLRRKKLEIGAEPDESFYIQNAARVVDHLETNLESDPPPDLVIEIDSTSESLQKFKIYAALGVPEIWRYDGRQAHFYALAGEGYEKIQNSIAFPVFAATALTRYLEQRKTEGHSKTLRAFRQMLRAYYFLKAHTPRSLSPAAVIPYHRGTCRRKNRSRKSRPSGSFSSTRSRTSSARSSRRWGGGASP